MLPHYDAWPEPFSALIALQAPRGVVVLGIDEDTAVVGRDGAWQVHGAGRVTVWRGRRRERFRRGEAFRIDSRPPQPGWSPGAAYAGSPAATAQSGRICRKQSEQ